MHSTTISLFREHAFFGKFCSCNFDCDVTPCSVVLAQVHHTCAFTCDMYFHCAVVHVWDKTSTSQLNFQCRRCEAACRAAGCARFSHLYMSDNTPAVLSEDEGELLGTSHVSLLWARIHSFDWQLWGVSRSLQSERSQRQPE